MKFAKRLDEEQETLDNDGVTISDADKKEHYLMQLYTSGVFPAATIREWKRRTAAQQTYALAKTFFEAEDRGLTEVSRLTGDTTRGNGFESAAAALEKGLDKILDKFNENVEQRIQHAVDKGLQQLQDAKQPTEEANATTERSIAELRDALGELTNSLGALQREFKSFASDAKKRDRGGDENAGNDRRKPKPKRWTWEDGMTLDPKWSTAKRNWYFQMLKHKDPKKYKKQMKEELEKRMKDLE